MTDLDTLSDGLRFVNICRRYLRQRQSGRRSAIGSKNKKTNNTNTSNNNNPIKQRIMQTVKLSNGVEMPILGYGVYGTATFVSPNWLVSTYLVLTFAELLLSPMGISFVSKVAPPKYKGMMMGGWFVATAIGNYGTRLASDLWGDMPLWVVWGVLMVLCLLAALFIFSVMKKLEKVA